MPRRLMAANVDMLDVNVWFALAIEDHPFHERAAEYWQNESSERFAFCRITALGLLRLCANPAAIPGDPMTVDEAWNAYAAFRGLPEVDSVTESESCEILLAQWAEHSLFTPKRWTDAYLAAFAISGGMRLVSFDDDFRKFAGLDFLHLRS
jgi:toxin-antitoxin system PIN domain toxin